MIAPNKLSFNGDFCISLICFLYDLDIIDK